MEGTDCKALLDYMDGANISLRIKAKDVEPDAIAHHISSLMESMHLLDPQKRAEMEIAMVEALINAVDYGCLELKQSEKASDLTSPSIYHKKRRERLADERWGYREIHLRISFDPEKISFRIQDPGPGLPEVLSKHREILPYGRGLQLMRKLVDRLIVKRNPSILTMIKYRG